MMRRAKRLTIRPVVLLVLLGTLLWQSGCVSAPHSQRGSPESSATASPSGAPGTEEQGDAVAVVGGEPITRGELMRELMASYGPAALHALMVRRAVEKEAKAAGIAVTDADVQEEIRSRSQGYDSVEQYYKAMKEQLGLTPDQVRKDAELYVLEQKLAARPVRVTDEEVDAYIREHPEAFGPRTVYHLSHIVVAEKQQAQRLLDRLKKGEDFAALAQEASVDGTTAGDGGDLGWLDPADPFVDGQLLETAKTLSVGQVAGPLQTADGWELVKLIGREVRQGEDGQAARERIRRQLALERAVSIPELEQSLLDKYGAQVLDPALQP